MLTKEDAIKLIKQVIDESVKAGLFHNVETANSVFNAWTIITHELNKEI